MSEQQSQSELRLYADMIGVRLFRNNSGAMLNPQGRIVRFGLGHDAPNMSYKSSDLIGWTPRIITPEMCGKTVAIFTAVEVKKPGWTRPTDNRERKQEVFLEMVRDAGGLAGFATSLGDLSDLIIGSTS